VISMIKEPAFKEHFHVAVIPPHAVYLLTERGHTVLTGRLFALLAPLLDGSHTVGAIIDALGDQVTAATPSSWFSGPSFGLDTRLQPPQAAEAVALGAECINKVTARTQKHATNLKELVEVISDSSPFKNKH
jgi:hypothetical protein